MPRRALRSYPTYFATDLTDVQWAAIAPLVITPSPNGGRPTEIDRRAIVNALLYKNRTGCQWRMLPKDFPPIVRFGTISTHGIVMEPLSKSMIRCANWRDKR